MKLVDDLYGKIDHILLSCSSDMHALLAEELAGKMPSDVIISVAYPKGQEGPFGKPPKALDKLQKSHKNVEPFPINGIHTIWIQDTIHAYENKTLMHSTPRNILTASPDEIKMSGNVLAPEKGTNILDADYWDDTGFRIAENDATFMVAGGEIERCGNTAYFGAGAWVDFLGDVAFQDRKYAKDIKMFLRFGAKRPVIEKMFRSFKGHIRYLSDSCEQALIGPSINKEVGLHLDLYFHPNENGCFVSRSSLYCENDANFSIENRDLNIEKNLGLLKIEKCRDVPLFLQRSSGKEVCVIQDYSDGEIKFSVMKNESPFYSPINSLYEVYKEDGKTVRNVYMPHYGSCFEPATKAAEESFTAEGFDVKRIGFPIMDARGGLRCCTKVLRRK